MSMAGTQCCSGHCHAGVSLPPLRAECWGVELLCLAVLSWAVVQCTTLPVCPVGAHGLHSCHVVAL